MTTRKLYKLPKTQRTTHEHRFAFEQKLRVDGYQEIGCGSYASVYYKKGSDRVLKVGVDWDEYLQYIKLIGLNAKNPFFPKIYSVKLYTPSSDHGFYVAEMEHLKPYTYTTRKKERKKFFQILGINNLDDMEVIDRIRPTNNASREVKNVLKVAYQGRQPDIHRGNIMWRIKRGKNPQLVITDPVA